MKTTLSLALASLMIFSGCGENTFGGGSGKNAGSDRSASTNQGAKSGDAKGDTDLTMDPPADATPEQEAIGKCLKVWGSSPFDHDVYTNYRKIAAAVTIFGGGGNAVEDTEATSQPKLIVISASVSVLSTTNYLLMNPNGWYCIMADVNVKSQTTVSLQCKAHLADSKVEVNVGSKASPTAAVGVNVLSDVKVERKPSADAPTGC